METELLTEKYKDKMEGVLQSLDRIVLIGHLNQFCYSQAMTDYLYRRNIRIFDFPNFVQPLREQIRNNAEAIAKANNITIEYVRKKKFRKEERIQKLLETRGNHPGLVHIFSAMESCIKYKPWYDKIKGRAHLKSDTGNCLHYYFYFIHEQLGLCYLRVSTWAPYQLQFYFNGHAWLASQLKQKGIVYELIDNAFVHIDDYETANQIAQDFDVKTLHTYLDDLAKQYCPVIQYLDASSNEPQQLFYRWSIMQAEYATDLVFKEQATLQAFYHHLLEALIQAVKPADVATFLGRKLSGNYQGEIGNRFNKRWLGCRIKHHMGSVSIKMYDKFNLVLRIETTVNDVSFFRQYRQVNHRDGSTSHKWAPMRKSIYSLPALRESLSAANYRYLKFISEIATPEVGAAKLQSLSETQVHNDHRYKGFNLLSKEDSFLLCTIAQGQFTISGFTNKDLRQLLSYKSSSQVSRLLKRLRVHGLIKKVGLRYKYYLTDFGRQTILTALKLRELVIIPDLAFSL